MRDQPDDLDWMSLVLDPILPLGRLDVVRWLREEVRLGEPAHIDPSMWNQHHPKCLHKAVRSGNVELLHYLNIECHMPLTESTLDKAVCRLHLDVVRWMVEEAPNTLPCPGTVQCHRYLRTMVWQDYYNSTPNKPSERWVDLARWFVQKMPRPRTRLNPYPSVFGAMLQLCNHINDLMDEIDHQEEA